MTYHASVISKWFLTFASDTQEGHSDITNLKLQKLLYYAQGHWLAEHDEPLFSEPIKAWNHGPVVPQIWNDYKDSGTAVLPIPGEDEFDWSDVSKEVDAFLIRVWNAYGGYTGWALRNRTHREEPWLAVEPPLDENPHEITHDRMRNYFQAHPLAA